MCTVFFFLEANDTRSVVSAVQGIMCVRAGELWNYPFSYIIEKLPLEENTLKIATALTRLPAPCQCEYSVPKEIRSCNGGNWSLILLAWCPLTSPVDHGNVASLRLSCQTLQHVLEQGLSSAVPLQCWAQSTPLILCLSVYHVVGCIRGVLEHWEHLVYLLCFDTAASRITWLSAVLGWRTQEPLEIKWEW